MGNIVVAVNRIMILVGSINTEASLVKILLHVVVRIIVVVPHVVTVAVVWRAECCVVCGVA